MQDTITLQRKCCNGICCNYSNMTDDIEYQAPGNECLYYKVTVPYLTIRNWLAPKMFSAFLSLFLVHRKILIFDDVLVIMSTD